MLIGEYWLGWDWEFGSLYCERDSTVGDGCLLMTIIVVRRCT
jgi:hypothetical protein